MNNKNSKIIFEKKINFFSIVVLVFKILKIIKKKDTKNIIVNINFKIK